jgi:hypothetical protein
MQVKALLAFAGEPRAFWANAGRSGASSRIDYEHSPAFSTMHGAEKIIPEGLHFV